MGNIGPRGGGNVQRETLYRVSLDKFFVESRLNIASQYVAERMDRTAALIFMGAMRCAAREDRSGRR